MREANLPLSDSLVNRAQARVGYDQAVEATA
jgi:hypothetical protein